MKDETLIGLEEYAEQQRKEASNGYDGSSEEAHSRYMDSLKVLREIEHDNMEYYDKQDRREIEKKKNDDAKAIEDAKQKVGAPRFILEIAKIAVPVVTATIAAVTAVKMQNKSGVLEESGRWTTEASRMAHNQIPRMWGIK